MSQTACKLSPEPKVRPKIQLLQSGAGSKSGTFGPLGKKIIIGTQDFINSWNIKKKICYDYPAINRFHEKCNLDRKKFLKITLVGEHLFCLMFLSPVFFMILMRLRPLSMKRI